MTEALSGSSPAAVTNQSPKQRSRIFRSPIRGTAQKESYDRRRLKHSDEVFYATGRVLLIDYLWHLF